MESFAGFGSPLAPGAGFWESGAAIDGAQPVQDEHENFLDILAHSPALPTVKTIFGHDDRSKIANTTSFPYRTIALVTFDGGFCTGWLFGPDVVATMGQCVHTGGTGGHWQTNVRVYPGRNGSSAPFGSCGASRLYSVLGWTTNQDEAYDYGAIKLDCTVGNTTGYLGFFWQTATLTNQTVSLPGYPSDKGLTLWKSSGKIALTQSQQLFYKLDTAPGESGAPLLQNRTGCGQCVMGTHGYHVHGSPPHNQYNHGTRITQPVFNNMLDWRNAAP
jgi:glutamyl endopeptidase